MNTPPHSQVCVVLADAGRGLTKRFSRARQLSLIIMAAGRPTTALKAYKFDAS